MFRGLLSPLKVIIIDWAIGHLKAKYKILLVSFWAISFERIYFIMTLDQCIYGPRDFLQTKIFYINFCYQCDETHLSTTKQLTVVNGKTNIAKFKDNLLHMAPSVLLTDNVEVAADQYNKVLHDLVETHAPMKRCKVKIKEHFGIILISIMPRNAGSRGKGH